MDTINTNNVDALVKNIIRANLPKKEWFDYDTQDKLMLEIAVKLYLQDKEYEDDPANFWDNLEEAKGMLNTFYNHRYNKNTRTGR